MDSPFTPRIKESRNQRYECHLDIHPNQRRMCVWHSAGMNALWHFPGFGF